MGQASDRFGHWRLRLSLSRPTKSVWTLAPMRVGLLLLSAYPIGNYTKSGVNSASVFHQRAHAFREPSLPSLLPPSPGELRCGCLFEMFATIVRCGRRESREKVQGHRPINRGSIAGLPLPRNCGCFAVAGCSSTGGKHAVVTGERLHFDGEDHRSAVQGPVWHVAKPDRREYLFCQGRASCQRAPVSNLQVRPATHDASIRTPGNVQRPPSEGAGAISWTRKLADGGSLADCSIVRY